MMPLLPRKHFSCPFQSLLPEGTLVSGVMSVAVMTMWRPPDTGGMLAVQRPAEQAPLLAGLPVASVVMICSPRKTIDVAAVVDAALIEKNSMRNVAGPWVVMNQRSVVLLPALAGAAAPAHVPEPSLPTQICGAT